MKKGKSLVRGVLATACSAAMAVALVPAAAFAADGAAGDNAVDGDATAALTVQTEAVDAEGNQMSDPVTVKSYTQADLDALAAANTTTLHYEYGGHGAGQAGTLVTTSKYVTVDQLMSDAGVTQWSSGASLSFICGDGPYGKYSPTYDEATTGYYYPNYSVEEFDKTGAEAVPAVVTLSYKKDSIDPGAKASEVAASSTQAESADQMFAMGTQNTSPTINMGRTFPNGVNTIIVKYQPTVTVQTQAVDAEGNAMSDPVDAKSYTLSDLDKLAAANTTTLHYQYAGRRGATLVTTSKYVTVDQLVSDAGVTQWGAGSSLSFICSDGPYGKANPTYEQATSGNYYPNYSVTDYDATGKVSVPAALALTSKKDSITAGTTAAETAAASTAAESTEGAPMFAIGTSDETYAGKAVNGGNVFPTGVATIIVKYQPTLTVRTQLVDDSGNAVGSPVDAKTYTLADLDKLAAANTTTLHYEYGGHGAGQAGTLVTTSKYVTVDQLVSDAGVTQWGAGSSLSFICSDGPYGKYAPTYEEATGGYYFPSYTASEFDKTGATAVPAVLTLTQKKDSISGSATAAETAASSTTAENTEQTPMFAMGTLSTATSMNMGRTFPTGVATITVNYKQTVNPTPGPTVTKKANTVKVSKANISVKKGKSVKVAVKSAKGKVTVKSSSKKIAKVSYSSKTKKVTIKGVKKGKATVTVSAAGNDSYKAGKKTIKVTVKK